jgi:hypothetical protein
MVKQEKPDWPGFYRACGDDQPVKSTIAVAKALHETGHELWLFSGRSIEVVGLTFMWLALHDLGDLFMNFKFRLADDFRPDDVIKKLWYDEMSQEDKDRLLMVFDDRDRLAKMWRSLGVTCFQVADGDF